MTRYNVILASNVIDDVLAAEIYAGDELAADVRRLGGDTILTIFDSNGSGRRVLEASAFADALAEAVRRLGPRVG